MSAPAEGRLRGLHRTFRLSPPQLAFCSAALHGRARYIAYVGGVGSGKTWAGCVAALNLSLAFPDNRGVIASGTERQLGDTARREFAEILDRYGLSGQVIDQNKSEARVVFANGSEILFRSMEAYERLLSLNLGWFWIDEAAGVPVEGFKVLMSRLRLGGPRPVVGLVTSNPDAGWLQEVFRDKAWTDDVRLIQARTESNRRLPPDYAADLRRAFRGAWARRYLDGQFAPMEGLVYGGFDPARHVLASFDPPADWTLWRAIDFGYANPFVCLFFALSSRGHAVVYDEHAASQTLIEDHARAVAARSEGRVFAATWADHDAQGRAELNALGLPTLPARKELLPGIAETVRRLGQEIDGVPALRIAARCRLTLSEIVRYRWDRSDPGQERPVKENDHAMDALRYGLYGLACRRAAAQPAILTAPRRRIAWSLG